MNDAALVPQFNETTIRQALLDAQGDIFTAAQLLGHVTVMKLDRAIRQSIELQNVFLTIKQVKALPEYDRISQEQLEVEVARRQSVYRADGLEVLHELATMEHKDNSAMAQVKLAAAARLIGPTAEKEGVNELQQTLADLNAAYHQNAPRIKIQRTTTIEMGPQERTVSEQ